MGGTIERQAKSGEQLTDDQRDGTACVTCGADLAAAGRSSVPAGTVDGGQVFACASHDPTERRPYWLPYGCPTWCTYDGMHDNNEGYEDRTHIGRRIDVELTAEDPQWARLGEHGNRVDFGDAPSTVAMYLTQHYREIEPRIWLGRDDSADGVHLTLDEAKRVAGALAGLVDGLSLFGQHRDEEGVDRRIVTARRVLAESQAVDYEGDPGDRATAVRRVGQLEAQLLLLLQAIEEMKSE